MIRTDINEPWRTVGWDEAINYAAEKLKEIQIEHGRFAIGGITSSRCTNEEIWLVQKTIRAAFSNNNVDTCARVCHSPTGYGLKQTYGTSAGTQHFDSVQSADVILVIGANPTDGHPVFASRLKRRMRQGARLIVVDPRRIDLVRMPHVEAAHHLPLTPGTNVAVMNALAHVVVTEGLVDEAFVDLEVRPDDPYSVTLNYIVKDGKLYIDPAEDRTWYQYLKEDDRVRHVETLNANAEPVFFSYRGNNSIDGFV